MRTRIVTMALLAATLALVLFGVPLAIGLAHLAVTDEKAALQRVANFTARSVQHDLIHEEVPDSLPDVREGTTLALYDADGRRTIGTGPLTADAQVTHSLDAGRGQTTDDGPELVVTVPVSDTHDVIAVVRAATPITEVHRELLPTWLGMAALAALVLGAVWVLARRHARRLAQPLEQLSANARRLGDGDFSVHTAAVGIREIDAVGSALNSTAERLDGLLARERAFSADASHQLRTPLTGLRLRLEAALETSDHELRRAVVDGIAAADRLEQTIDELLLLAREGPGTRGEAVDLDLLAEEIQDGWRPRLAAAGRSLLVQLEAPLPAPLASAAATRQVLAVLLDNAEVHGAGTVRVTIRAAGDAIAVDVSDEGPGLDLAGPAPFTGARRESPGHGIGLALARRLAEAEDGRLVVTQPSPPVFTLFLAARWPAAGEPSTTRGEQVGLAR